jgi:hypothetical protein
MMEENEAKNCWEFMKCPEEIKINCEAYKRDFGKECWMVSKDTGKGCYAYKKYNGCRKCPWFIKNAIPTW